MPSPLSILRREVSSTSEPTQRALGVVPVAPIQSTTALALVVASMTVVWTLVVGAAAVWRHQHFLSHRFDLGNMVQAVWSTAHGRPLETTDSLTGEQFVRLGSHVDPILLLFTPLWVLFPAPEVLIVAQAAALACGVYPIARLSLKHVGDPAAAGLLSLWYLTFPWLVWLAFNDFHPVAFAVPLLLFALWFLDEDRLGAFALCAGLALLTGELIGLTLAGIGVWYALGRRRAWTGGAIACVGVAWTLLCLYVVIPAFNEGRSSRFSTRFESVGGSPSGFARTLLTDPGAAASQMTQPEDLNYLLALLFPTAFVALAAPLMLVAVIPQLSLNLLSDWWSTTQPTFQYSAVFLPALFAASIIAIGKISRRYRVWACAVLLVLSTAQLTQHIPRPGTQEFVYGALDSSEHHDSMRAALGLVPAGEAVTATNRLGAHLSDRRVVQLFPMREGSRWAILDLQDPWLQVAGEQEAPRRFRSEIRRLEQDPSWRLIYDRSDVRVYVRTH